MVKHYPQDFNGFCPQFKNGEKLILPGDRMFIKPAPDGKQISKLYDVKDALKKVINGSTNDLIIAAGDESNDEEMLNPLNYLDLYGINIDKHKPVSEILKDENALEALGKMPFAAIIVGSSKKLDHLREMDKMLREKGINKIICIPDSLDKNNGFVEAIKTAMYDYAEKNPLYSYEMGMDLYTSLMDGGSIWS